MFKLKKLNVIRIVETKEEKAVLESQGFEEMGEVKPDYDNMAYNDLKQIAKDKNVEGYFSMKKEDLIAVLKGLESEGK
ncbi:Rho termination factor N-terminal domain-containing protein [Clostridium coskatii]|uniref:Rho termination factor-like N-terminal domain-containing protein n=1 Tax=Clostridium coskatii TaxID=1705578 RepID=A0A162L3Q7_9CLOT|nr:Rho termination factor N-terminal domain-containing protein [Clostridium coskatii]OAA90712.1 hypothetical protein WX73_02077 [Clostridium coskatii]OBR97452.1 hypothetical protein CLCOS_03080 [Clostridium coskatii]